MAKITIAGDSMVITSSKTLEDIKTLEKYRPSALTLTEVNDEGKKEVVFKVGSTQGGGAINQYGASFNSATHDEAKLATITLAMPVDVEDAKQYAADLVGVGIVKLNKVEVQFDAALVEIDKERDEVLSNISVAQ